MTAPGGGDGRPGAIDQAGLTIPPDAGKVCRGPRTSAVYQVKQVQRRESSWLGNRLQRELGGGFSGLGARQRHFSSPVRIA
jgi:hypothetical protein